MGETSLHYLQEWYIAIPLLILVVVGVATLVYFASRRSKAITYLSISGLLLIAGIGLYSESPIASTVALSTGIAMTLFLVLASLMAPAKGK